MQFWHPTILAGAKQESPAETPVIRSIVRFVYTGAPAPTKRPSRMSITSSAWRAIESSCVAISTVRFSAARLRSSSTITAYAYLFNLPTTALRFFTVYGPWGRPDMAMWIFATAISNGKPIKLFNQGKMRRDFTYIDDVVQAVVRLIDRPAKGDPNWSSAAPDPASSSAPWRVYNIGNNSPVDLLDVVSLLEQALGKKAIRELLPMQPGDVPATFANVDDLMRDVGFKPSTPIAEGIARFIAWYKQYHQTG